MANTTTWRQRHALRFSEFAHMDSSRVSPRPCFLDGDFEDVFISQDDVLSTIFAPDPSTGFPRSDLHLVLSKDSAPEVSQYVRDTLMRPLSSSSSVVDDADVAIESVRLRNEDIITYGNRLREIVSRSSKSEKNESK